MRYKREECEKKHGKYLNKIGEIIEISEIDLNRVRIIDL